MDPKRRLARKILLGSLLALGLVTGIVQSLVLRLDASIERHRAEIAALLDDVPVRHSNRPALAAPEEPGNVWDLLRPAFDALWALQEPTPMAEISTNLEANFNAHGSVQPTRPLLERGSDALEACRQSRRRSALDWTGPIDPDLCHKAARAGRALCSRGFLAWQEGRDAEAMDWLLTALSVAYDAARLAQKDTGRVLVVIERWVCEDARCVMEEQGLTAAELDDVGRRLDQLRAQRPPLSPLFRTSGAQRRKDFLEDCALRASLEAEHEDLGLPVKVGWRDLWVAKLYRARVLTGIRAGMEEAGAVPWTGGVNPFDECQRLHSRYREDVLAWLSAEADLGVLGPQRLEAFRAALSCARFQAATGRLPATVDEVGVRPSFKLDGDTLLPPGLPGDENWKLGRRP